MAWNEVVHLVADLTAIAAVLGAAVAWTWTVWQIYRHVVKPVSRVNGELAEAARHLAAIRLRLDMDARIRELENIQCASVLGPLDGGPPQ